MKRGALMAVTAAALLGLGGCGAALVLLWLRPAAGPPRPLNTVTVIQRIQTLSQLVTVKYVLEKMVVLDDPKYLANLIPLGENRVVLLAHGEVRAGVDFSQVTNDDVSISGRRITFTIPKAIVTDAYLVEQYTKVLDRKTGLFIPFDKDLEQTARQYALAEITHAARQSGIEAEAATRAKAQLTTFLQALGFEAVEVRTRGR